MTGSANGFTQLNYNPFRYDPNALTEQMYDVAPFTNGKVCLPIAAGVTQEFYMVTF